MPDIFISDNLNKNQDLEVEQINSPTPQPSKVQHLSEEFQEFSTNILSAFRLNPKKAKFINKGPDEKIILILRRHPFTNLGWIAITIAMLFGPAALVIFPILSFLPDNYQFVAVIGWYMITVAFAFENFISWFFNVNIITNERVVDVNFVNLIYRETSEAEVGQIQEAQVRVGSVRRTLFNYGDVAIQTASEKSGILFEAVPYPDRVTKILRDLRIAKGGI